jgi:hypothetical protein
MLICKVGFFLEINARWVVHEPVNKFNFAENLCNNSIIYEQPPLDNFSPIIGVDQMCLSPSYLLSSSSSVRPRPRQAARDRLTVAERPRELTRKTSRASTEHCWVVAVFIVLNKVHETTS